MKHWFVGVCTLLVLLVPVSSFAAVAVADKDGVYLGEATILKGFNGFDNNAASVSAGVDVEKRIPIDIGDALIRANAGSAAQTGASTSPSLSKKAAASGIFLRWNDGVTSPAQLKFRIPSNYQSGGAFRLTVGRSGGDLAPAIDFQVFIDADETAFDAAATNQTPVTLSTAINGGSPEQLTLSVTTDFASLAAQDLVTLELWRDDTNTSTEDLELYHVEFFYTARD